MAEESKKPREIHMKIGSYKYLLQLLHGLKRELRRQRKTLRYLALGLADQMNFNRDYIRDVACADEIDEAILTFLRSADSALPRDIAHNLGRITPWNVTLRIRRMNKRLDSHIGQKVAEKQGLQWALTSFVDMAWQEDEDEEP